jgi:hypothetical protein
MQDFQVIAEHTTLSATLEAVDWGTYIGHQLSGSGYSVSRFFDKDGDEGRSINMNLHNAQGVTVSRFSIEGGQGGIRISGTFRGDQPFQINLWDKYQ